MQLLKKVFDRLLSRSFYKRQYKKVLSVFVRLPRTPEPVLIMTLLVKNEDDTLENNLIFHKAMGVDGFIVTDNNSTDKTPDILKKYKEKEWIKEIIVEKADNHMQAKWVDRMIQIAKNKYSADWVINADADEFWYCNKGNLKLQLSTAKSNILCCRMLNMNPQPGKAYWKWDYVIERPLDHPERVGLSKYSVFAPQILKVIHRTAGYVRICEGNHWVDMKPEKIARANEVRVYHYPLRSKEQFLRKIINGGETLSRHPDLTVGVHWRDLYNMYLQNHFDAEYKKIIGEGCTEAFIQQGILKKDTSISDFVQTLNLK